MKKRENIPIFHSNVKWNILKNDLVLNKKINILDLAIGRGGDLFKYTDTYPNIDVIYGIDIDETAIEECKSRWIESSKKTTGKLEAVVQDVNKTDETIQCIKKYMGCKKFDLIVCNFAFHYFVENEEKTQNIINLIETFCKKGTLVWITCPDGEALTQLLHKYKTSHIVNSTYELKSLEGNKVQYKIKSRYFDTAKPGHEIIMDGVSNEYLVNVSLLDKLFTNAKFKNIQQSHFSNWMSSIKNNLTNLEKEISSANISLIYKRQ